jgi:hypothetical protein
MRHPHVDVTIAGKGTIKIHAKPVQGGFVTKFENIPSYIGDNRVDGIPDGIRFRFPGLYGHFDVTLDVEGAFGCTASKPSFNGRDFPLTNGAHVLKNVVDPSPLWAGHSGTSTYRQDRPGTRSNRRTIRIFSPAYSIILRTIVAVGTSANSQLAQKGNVLGSESAKMSPSSGATQHAMTTPFVAQRRSISVAPTGFCK